MTLTPPEVYPNAAVDLDGNGTVISSDGSVTLVAREDGKVDTYVTGHFMENATVPEPPADQPEPAPYVAGSATIPADQPEPAPSVAGSATIGTAPVTATDPVASSATDSLAVPESHLDPTVNPAVQSDSEKSVDEQIAEARAKLDALEQEKSQSNPDGNRTQS